MNNEKEGSIFLADDEASFRRLAKSLLEARGHHVIDVADAKAALDMFPTSGAEVAVLDLVMPPHFSPEAGLDLLDFFAKIPVIILTGHADHELALKAVEKGAWDFLAKPVEPEMLLFSIDRALRQARLKRELQTLRAREAQSTEDMGLIGRSDAMDKLRQMIRRLAGTRLPVVILGQTGTGKELVAKALHDFGTNRHGPFIPIHCGALPSELLESELFGHLKGSFTGALRDQRGLVEAAHNGTLFLDEIGEMPLAMQVKLLRFLQDGSFTPLGARESRRVDVRVVAATHRDLEAMVNDGSFREDLYYRLKGFILRTPSLTERREDIPLLAEIFLRRAAPGTRLSRDALTWLTSENWPGNVRELRSLIETAAVLIAPETSREVDVEALRFARGDSSYIETTEMPEITKKPVGRLDRAIAELERQMLQEALRESGGNQSEAARLLGISRVGLIKKLTRLSLRPV
jgi:DNA-binding NtrC family response regulator